MNAAALLWRRCWEGALGRFAPFGHPPTCSHIPVFVGNETNAAYTRLSTVRVQSIVLAHTITAHIGTATSNPIHAQFALF